MSYFSRTFASLGEEHVKVTATLARRRAFHSPSEPNCRRPECRKYDSKEKHRTNQETGRNYKNLQNTPGDVRPAVPQQTSDDHPGHGEYAADESGRPGVGEHNKKHHQKQQNKHLRLQDEDDGTQ